MAQTSPRGSKTPSQTQPEAPTARRMSRLEAQLSKTNFPRNLGTARTSRLSTASNPHWALGGFKIPGRVANTYRMAPTRHERFKSHVAQKIMKSVLESHLDGETYGRLMCVSLCKGLADLIKERMKDQGWSPRYKYVCTVTLGEVKDQSLTLASRCLWSTDTDNYATATFRKGSLFAVATLYALYFE